MLIACVQHNKLTSGLEVAAAGNGEAARRKDLEDKLAEVEEQSSVLQAHNEQLESQLSKAMQLYEQGGHVASLVQPPSYWHPHALGQTLLYVYLPFPGPAKLTDEELMTHHKKWVQDMQSNDIGMKAALAALRSVTAPVQHLVCLMCVP